MAVTLTLLLPWPGPPDLVEHACERQLWRWWDARNRAAARFLDLGLITAKRLITRRWKSSDPPVERAWKSSFEVWAGAEGVALAREDALGLRKYPLPLSVSWEAMLACLRGLGQTSDVEVAV
ncbi:hypothetical protein NDU88_002928 [Pleurodeles waltl]|uniref:Uncharacterized protein n=1 Tax=Pleurodeles waltl TaxID=8319 RepID=A0AAV7SEU6_PLEWA|nr:hypothetical protein NDU88_002928 [Pleurodeles waltl]